MLIKILDPAFSNSINQKFREKRFKFFLSLLKRIKTDKTIQILDIGGTEAFWERMNFTDKENVIITLLNIEKFPTKYNTIRSVIGDACDLSSFRNKEFDIVFSNSVIEHLFSFENQKKMASEVMRVGKYYYIQTPNLYFPIEPHWLFPFFQFLPFKVQVFLTDNFDLGHYKKSLNKENAIKRVNEVRLLTQMQMKHLFPNGKVYREFFLGLVKSFTLYHFPED